MICRLFLLAFLQFGSALCSDQASTPLVKLQAGSVQGSLCDSTNVRRFRAIPYAQPPIGKRRFMPPYTTDVVLGSDGHPFNATQPAVSCPQFSINYSESGPESEACLTVDVYMPADADQKSPNLPVKVWTYGGGDEGGSINDAQSDACNLATDAVVVEFNYRIGPLGFLYDPDAGIQGNMAIQDALAALQWVQDNIAAFGGDKTHVLLFGQSSGADNVFALSTLPGVDRLISAVILESASSLVTSPRHIAQTVGQSFAQELNCSDTKSSSIQSIKKAYANIPAANQSTAPGQNLDVPYGVSLPDTLSMPRVVLDGRLFTQEPLRTGPKVPVLAGADQNDAAFMSVTYLARKYKGINLTEETYDGFLALWGPKLGAAIGKEFPLSKFNASGSTNDAVYEATAVVSTLAGYICPSYYIMQSAQAAGVAAYAYRFNHTPSCQFEQSSPQMGSEPFPPKGTRNLFGPCHGSELPFVFGSLDRMPLGNGNCNSTAAEHALSDEMRASWTAMAASGSPKTPALDWPRFDTCGRQGVLFGQTGVISQLQFTSCQFWAEAWNELTDGRLSFLSQNATCPPHGSAPSSSASATTAASGTPMVPISSSSSSRPIWLSLLVLDWILACAVLAI